LTKTQIVGWGYFRYDIIERTVNLEVSVTKILPTRAESLFPWASGFLTHDSNISDMAEIERESLWIKIGEKISCQNQQVSSGRKVCTFQAVSTSYHISLSKVADPAADETQS